ncbi:tyrosine-type recombinase/integrase [Clostridium omnivorum]|uniref:Tyrosine recombinase XerC n=1 Tax=Clostridium omnivorum TaxID=1604902 RepID=A0ABQ5NAF9_9CLOT|nr:tyrosine-type recombinase/integrase [Clostridium sp. E14]GLC32177.1 tyrosine recombinase XerC [Clostridium sp. E14]
MVQRKKIELKREENQITFDRLFDEFIVYQKSKNLRQHTIKHYENTVNSSFYKYIDCKTEVKNITSKTIEGYINFLKSRGNIGDVTINTYLRDIRAILYYAMKEGYLAEYKIKQIKADKEIIETYTDEELIILLKKPDVKKCNFIEFRNWTISNILIGTGMRIQTLVNIKIEDIDLSNDLIYYSHTKNRKNQVVPISSTLKSVLIDYLKYRKGEEEDYLITNIYGEQLKTNLLSQNMCKYHRSRGITKTGLHRYRHTFAKKWILNNGDIFRLQKILGHSSMDIVREYVEMFTEDLQRDFNIFNPLESLSIRKTSIKMRV